MRHCLAILLLIALPGGCSGPDGKTFSVFFQPYSADLDPQAQDTVHAAAAFAQAHPLMPLAIPAYPDRPDPSDLPTLREQRVHTVLNALVDAGVDRFRIGLEGGGLAYTDGVPGLTPGRVDIAIGL